MITKESIIEKLELQKVNVIEYICEREILPKIITMYGNKSLRKIVVPTLDNFTVYFDGDESLEGLKIISKKEKEIYYTNKEYKSLTR